MSSCSAGSFMYAVAVRQRHHALRHSAQEGERRHVSVAERLRGLRGICFYEYAVAVLAPYERPRLTEVALRVARWVFQRHEHLTHHTPALPNVILDYGVAAIEPVLLLQPLEDALGRVALLLRRAQIIFEYAVYDARVRLKLGAMGRALPAVSRWHGVREHLAHGVSVQTEHPGRLPDAHPLYQARLAHAQIHVHDVHPCHLPSESR